MKWLLSKSLQDLSVKPFGYVSEGGKPVEEIPDKRGEPKGERGHSLLGKNQSGK